MDTKRDVLDLIRSFCQRPNIPVPAEVVDQDVFYDGLSIAVSHAGGIALVSAVEGDGEEWFFTVTCGAAIDVPDIPGTLFWANTQNRRIAFGRYYCAIVAERSLAAVVYEDSLPGQYLDMTNQGSRNLVLTMAFSMFADAAELGGQLVANHGGRLFGTNDAPTLAVIRG